MNKDNYTIFDWKGDEYIEVLTRSKAKKYYNTFMEAKNSRIEELQNLLGEKVNLDFSQESLDYIAYYLSEEIKKQNIEKNYPPEKERNREFIFGRALTPFLRSIGNDISIYIAEMWFKKYPNLLRWEMMPTSKGLEGSNFPGITGFPFAIYKKYNYSITYYIYVHIYALITEQQDFLGRALIRKYQGNVSELKKLSLLEIPPIPYDLLKKYFLLHNDKKTEDLILKAVPPITDDVLDKLKRELSSTKS